MNSEKLEQSKRRTQAEKVGRLKYIIQLQKRILREIKVLETRQRTIFHGLKDFFEFDQPYLEKVICKDEVDQVILQRLLEIGNGGMLPSDLAQELKRFRLDRWKVSARIKRMNKKLRKELGQNVAEKRGHEWALTGFTRRIWIASAKEFESEKQKEEEY